MIELDIINSMLETTGEYPLTTLEDDHPHVATCRAVIKRCLTKVYAQRWWFCTDEVKLEPQAGTGLMLAPQDLAELLYPSDRYIIRAGKIYDRKDSTFVIGQDLRITYLRKVPLDELPQLAIVYLTAMARYEYQTSIDADSLRAQQLSSEMRDAMIMVNAEHTRQTHANLNMLQELQDSAVRRSTGGTWRWGNVNYPHGGLR